jgi:glycosyltransferase involved in cell wall biosynthesis
VVAGGAAGRPGLLRLGAVPSNKVAVVANGIDVESYQRAGAQGCRTEGEFVIGTVGRLAEVKRQDLLIRAFARLATDADGLRLLLVGDGPERKRLESLAAELAIADRVKFAGYQPSPERFLAQMDVFALTSRHEALPLSLLEAWASGLPVISSAVGGIPQVVDHGRTGLLFQSGDETALLRCLRKVIKERDYAAALAAEGKAEVEAKYSLSRMAADYELQYGLAKGPIERS